MPVDQEICNSLLVYWQFIYLEQVVKKGNVYKVLIYDKVYSPETGYSRQAQDTGKLQEPGVSYTSEECAAALIFIKKCKKEELLFMAWGVTVQIMCYILASQTPDDGEIRWLLVPIPECKKL